MDGDKGKEKSVYKGMHTVYGYVRKLTGTLWTERRNMSSEMWGYARVSTKEQNLARQLELLRNFGIPERNIRCDKVSGKSFDRREYNALVGTAETAPLMRKDDLLVIISLDRLGRNYKEIREQWNYIINELGVDIVVLDMPLLDTRNSGDSLDKKFIADLVLQILSYVAQKELENTRKRQEQGMAVMPVINGKKTSLKTGRPTGRPNAEYPKAWADYYERWRRGDITAKNCMGEMNLKRSTFYKMVNSYEHSLETH
jgi:DNA invertase Pin-like site-specific DNA recombinase